MLNQDEGWAPQEAVTVVASLRSVKHKDIFFTLGEIVTGLEKLAEYLKSQQCQRYDQHFKYSVTQFPSIISLQSVYEMNKINTKNSQFKKYYFIFL